MALAEKRFRHIKRNKKVGRIISDFTSLATQQ